MEKNKGIEYYYNCENQLIFWREYSQIHINYFIFGLVLPYQDLVDIVNAYIIIQT